jgi:hypothetical protein
MFVRPAKAGAKVPFEHNPRRFLAATGEDVPDDLYWARRRSHGDVVTAEPPKPVAAQTSPPAAAPVQTGPAPSVQPAPAPSSPPAAGSAGA